MCGWDWEEESQVQYSHKRITFSICSSSSRASDFSCLLLSNFSNSTFNINFLGFKLQAHMPHVNSSCVIRNKFSLHRTFWSKIFTHESDLRKHTAGVIWRWYEETKSNVVKSWQNKFTTQFYTCQWQCVKAKKRPFLWRQITNKPSLFTQIHSEKV